MGAAGFCSVVAAGFGSGFSSGVSGAAFFSGSSKAGRAWCQGASEEREGASFAEVAGVGASWAGASFGSASVAGASVAGAAAVSTASVAARC
ncbi:hypothetical protein XF35_24105 [Streptomyces platensis subsp. clarensis]|nr:hypothetical protein [Streptomyces platensis subsp. clarensis]